MGGHTAKPDYSPRDDQGLGLKQAVALLAIWSSLLPQAVSADRASRGNAPSPAPQAVAATDVVLHRGGVLRGIVLPSPSSPKLETTPAKPGLRIVLIQGGKVIAEAHADAQGRFAVTGLRGGSYVIAVAGPQGTACRAIRAWTATAAPPKASSLAQVVLGQGTVRAHGPAPAVSFSEAALVAGVVVGAVAAPIIYHNSQQSNRAPASP